MVGPERQRWRIEKAARFLRAADRAFAAEDWETAVSRAYYALYHAVIAVLEAKGGVSHDRWDHVQVQHDFRIQFSNRGFLFNATDAQILERTYLERLHADYERLSATGRTARDVIGKARQLHDKVLRMNDA